MYPQFIGVVNNSKDSVLGQRSDAAGEKMDVDVPAPAASSALSEGKTYSIGTSALCFRKDGMEIENPIEDGLGNRSFWLFRSKFDRRLTLMYCTVKNWDTIEKLWDHAFKDRLRINSEEHPMLLAVRNVLYRS
jgi:actin-like protein 6A